MVTLQRFDMVLEPLKLILQELLVHVDDLCLGFISLLRHRLNLVGQAVDRSDMLILIAESLGHVTVKHTSKALTSIFLIACMRSVVVDLKLLIIKLLLLWHN
jgi:hypothetical protein